MCKKQTLVSHSCAVLHTSTNQPVQGDLLRAKDERKHTNIKTKRHPNRGDLVLQNVDSVTSNAKLSHFGALLNIFEDNEAVTKMIIRGKSPTMRHVSRAHRDALDWSFDRISLEPEIQIKYVDTQNQLADMLTKGNFIRDELNLLLCLFNIMDISQFASGHFSSTSSSQTMSKRLIQQERPGEEARVVAKSKTMRSLVSKTVDQSLERTTAACERHNGSGLARMVGLDSCCDQF